MKRSSKRGKTQYRGQRLQRTPTKNDSNMSHDELSFFASQPKRAWEVLQGFQKLCTCFGLQPETGYMFANNFHNKVTSCEDEFYSCSSEDSEDDQKPENLLGSKNAFSTDKNDIILQLLQKIVNLIDNDEGAPSIPGESFNKKAPQPAATTRPDFLPWPPQACFCNCCDHMPPNNFSLPYPPFNLTTSALPATHIPKAFVYEESTNFHVVSSSNKNIPMAGQLPDNIPCACFSAQDPSEYNIKSPSSSHVADSNIKINASVQTGLKEEVGTDLDVLNKQNTSEEIDSFKDCSSGRNSMLIADQVPLHSTCKCVRNQTLLQVRDETLSFSCVPVAASANNAASQLPAAQARLNSNVDSYKISLEIRVQVDKELPFRSLDEICSEPFESRSAENFSEEELRNIETPLSPKLVDLAEPSAPAEFSQNGELKMLEEIKEPANPEEHVEVERVNEPAEPVQYGELNKLPDPVEIVDSIALEETKEPAKPEEYVEAEILNEPAELFEVQEEKTVKNITNATLETLSYNKDDDKMSLDKEEEEGVSSATAGQHIYNFLPEIDQPQDSKQLSTEENNAEEDYELAKEELSESRKSNKRDDEDDKSHDEETHLATLKRAETDSSSGEMKFFIDSLILDLEAMDQARRRSQFEKSICKPRKLAPCTRDSFPVTITDVTDLGANSLYVKWKIHDCCGIDGYEIFTDGYLTNRFYNSRHDAAVITQVDITLPHRITLVALPVTNDESWKMICNMSQTNNKLKSLPWKTSDEGRRQSSSTLWTPSVFLYDPNSAERAIAALTM